jgi:hypothetical protein
LWALSAAPLAVCVVAGDSVLATGTVAVPRGHTGRFYYLVTDPWAFYFNVAGLALFGLICGAGGILIFLAASNDPSSSGDQDTRDDGKP